MASRHVVIAIPAYAGTIHLATMRSLMADMTALMKRGDLVSIIDDCGNTDIADARASMASRFLSSDGTDLVFIDNDVSWEAGALLRLLDYPVDFVAGVYPKRAEPFGFPVQYIEDRPELRADPETGLLEVAGVPAGFMRCTRKMLETMSRDYGGLAYDRHGKTIIGLFDTMRIDGGKRKLSEDFSFCRRWREIGGKVWIDPEIKMGHVGSKTFTGSIGDWLRGRNVEA